MSRNFRVVVVDLPGFGATDGPFTMESAVDGLAEVIAECGGGPAHVCGMSLGAFVSLEFAAKYPELVDKLVVSGAPLVPAEDISGSLRVYRWLPMRLVRVFSDVRDRPTWLGMIKQLRATDLTPRLADIKSPTLVLCGSKDKESLAPARRIADGIERGQLRIVEGAGHPWSVHQPERFTRIVTDYLL